MSVYRKKGSTVYTMNFQFQGQAITESTGVRNKEMARRVERNRKTALEEGSAGLVRPKAAQLFAAVADEYIEAESASILPGETRGHARTVCIDQKNLMLHLKPFFGKMLLCDISPLDVARYQQKRFAHPAAPATVKNELGTFRSVMTRSGHWARLLPDIRMPEVDKDGVGRCIPLVELDAIFEACSLSESRLLYPAIFLQYETGSRPGTVKSLPWQEVDFAGRGLRWGRDKTASGTRRTIPVSQRAMAVLEVWAANFPHRKPHHYVFPHERYTQPKNSERGTKSPYKTDPTTPVVSLQRSWETALERAAWILAGRPLKRKHIVALDYRFHDLRHTACTRMILQKIPIPVIAQLVGWSPTTMWEMAKKYGHFSQDEMREAVESIGTLSGSLPKSLPYTPRRLAQPM